MTSVAASRVLNAFLGTYVDGIAPDSLEIGWVKGDVSLKNLALKPEAFSELPVDLVHGTIESLRVEFGVQALISDTAPRLSLTGATVVFHLTSARHDPEAVSVMGSTHLGLRQPSAETARSVGGSGAF